MGHLSNDEFFLRLAELFNERRQKDHGSVFLTQRRMSYSIEPKSTLESAPKSAIMTPTSSQTFSDLVSTQPFPIIIRATNGKGKENRDKKIKLSTIVESDSLEWFYAKYADVCKTGMSGLKKRDRSKAKEKLKAKKKKQVTGTVEIK